ncbi:MAG: oligosaccharide flippase family protein [Planctomycetota bacterium]
MHEGPTKPARSSKQLAADRNARGLGRKVAKGFALLFGKSLTTRVLNFLGTIVLAKLLLPEHFGLVALSLTVTQIVTVACQAGVPQVLVQRHRRFHLWAGPAFWLGIATAVPGYLVCAAIAPLAARMYDDPLVVGVILVLALEILVRVPGLVHRSKLISDMRYGLLAVAEVCGAIVQYGGAVILAVIDPELGAYALVWARVGGAATRVAINVATANVSIDFAFKFRRWKYLLSDSVAVLGGRLIEAFIGVGAASVVGVMYGAEASAAAAGVLYLAKAFSTQAAALLAQNLRPVLLPAMSKLKDDPDRLRAAAIKGIGCMVIAIGGVNVWQAVNAQPIANLVFGPKWDDAVLPFALLSISVLFTTIVVFSETTLWALGNFKGTLRLRLITLPAFLGFIALGTWLGQTFGPPGEAPTPETLSPADAMGVAGAAAGQVAFGIFSFLLFAFATQGMSSWKSIVHWIARPIIATGIGGLAAWFAMAFVPGTDRLPAGLRFAAEYVGLDHVVDVARIVVSSIVLPIVTLASAWIVAPNVVAELLIRLSKPAPASAKRVLVAMIPPGHRPKRGAMSAHAASDDDGV